MAQGAKNNLQGTGEVGKNNDSWQIMDPFAVHLIRNNVF